MVYSYILIVYPILVFPHFSESAKTFPSFQLLTLHYSAALANDNYKSYMQAESIMMLLCPYGGIRCLKDEFMNVKKRFITLKYDIVCSTFPLKVAQVVAYPKSA